MHMARALMGRDQRIKSAGKGNGEEGYGWGSKLDREGELCGEDLPRLWLAAEVRAFGVRGREFGQGVGRGECKKSNDEKRARWMTYEMLEQPGGAMRCSRSEEYSRVDSAAAACYNVAKNKQVPHPPPQTNHPPSYNSCGQLPNPTCETQRRTAAPQRLLRHGCGHYYCCCC